MADQPKGSSQHRWPGNVLSSTSGWAAAPVSYRYLACTRILFPWWPAILTMADTGGTRQAWAGLPVPCQGISGEALGLLVAGSL